VTVVLLALTRDDALLAGLHAHIDAWAGPHRVVSLSDQTTIAGGYNALVRVADADPDDILCFVHEDVRLLFDASVVLPRLFGALPDAGVLGFCGSASQQPGKQWWECPPRYGGLLQGGVGSEPLRYAAPTGIASGVGVEPVHTLDGYCLMARRSVYDAIGGFDESYGGWHCYDVDLCLRARRHGLTNYVVDLPSRHLSWGSSGPDLERSLVHFGELWAELLEDPPERHRSGPPVHRAGDGGERTGRPRVHVYGLALDAIDSVAGFVESCAAADAVHVLDLGSRDETVEALRTHGVSVREIELPDRLDVARNQSLELVPDDADVCVCLDVGEGLLPGWREELEAAWRAGATRISHPVELTADGGHVPGTQIDQRAHTRRGVVWLGRVHAVLHPEHGTDDNPMHLDAPLVRLQPGAGPDGREVIDSVRLRAAVEADGDDGHSRLLLAMEDARHDNWPEAKALATQALDPHSRVSAAERALACLLLAEEPDARSGWWLLAACDADPSRRGPWLELADECRRNGDLPGALWASRRALVAGVGLPAPFVEPDEWRWMGDDLASYAAWNLGRTDEALDHALAAVIANPFDDRIIGDHAAILRDVDVPVATGEPVVDVIVLSYAKTAREYDMTRRCILALRSASPEVPSRVIVVETNDRLQDEPFTEGVDELFARDVVVVQPGGRFAYNSFLRAGLDACAENPAPHVLVLNNDVVAFGRGFLSTMLDGLDEADSVSPLGLREARWWRPPEVPGVVRDDRVSFGLSGWCILFTRRIFDAAAPERYFPAELVWYDQDTHYADVLRSHGLRHGVVPAARALHLGSASHGLLGETLALPGDLPRLMQALGIRHLRCLVVGGDVTLIESLRGHGPAMLEVVSADAAGPGAAPGLVFDRIVLADVDVLDADVLQQWWSRLTPSGWLIGRCQDPATTRAALSGFEAAAGIASAVSRGGQIDTHFALQSRR
jgi:GT2 family glycosyltransferase